MYTYVTAKLGKMGWTQRLQRNCRLLQVMAQVNHLTKLMVGVT
jgi:hypothetical protein